MFNPYNWYWLADDGRLFSSSRGAVVSQTDATFKEWKKAGVSPTRWPSDEDGLQTNAALEFVLATYGLVFAESPIQAARERHIEKLSAACAAEIVGGYKSDALGELHSYPSKQVDQLNMMGSVTDALTPGKPNEWQTPFWCANASGEWAFRLHSAAQIIAAGQAGKAHVVACQSKLSNLTGQVNDAQSAEEIELIKWD